MNAEFYVDDVFDAYGIDYKEDLSDIEDCIGGNIIVLNVPTEKLVDWYRSTASQWKYDGFDDWMEEQVADQMVGFFDNYHPSPKKIGLDFDIKSFIDMYKNSGDTLWHINPLFKRIEVREALFNKKFPLGYTSYNFEDSAYIEYPGVYKVTLALSGDEKGGVEYVLSGYKWNEDDCNWDFDLAINREVEPSFGKEIKNDISWINDNYEAQVKSIMKHALDVIAPTTEGAELETRHIDVDIMTTKRSHIVYLTEPESGDTVSNTFGLDEYEEIHDWVGREIADWCAMATEEEENHYVD